MPEMRMNSLKSRAMNCGPLSEMMRGFASGYFSLARSRMTSRIDSRKSQCTRKRLNLSRMLHMQGERVRAAAAGARALAYRRFLHQHMRHVLLLDGRFFHRDNNPACFKTRQTLAGLTATTSASSIMNVSPDNLPAVLQMELNDRFFLPRL